MWRFCKFCSSSKKSNKHAWAADEEDSGNHAEANLLQKQRVDWQAELASAIVFCEDIADSGFSIRVGEEMPDFLCKTTQGDFQFFEFLQRPPTWTLLFSHPADFTPVCTTELCACHTQAPELLSKGIKMIGISCDSVADHIGWTPDILAVAGDTTSARLNFPIISDDSREIVHSLGMIDPAHVSTAGCPMPARAMYLIDPAKRLRVASFYPITTGRCFSELNRVVSALIAIQADAFCCAPANWAAGGSLLRPTTDQEDPESVDCPSLDMLNQDAAPQMPQQPPSDFCLKLGSLFPDFKCVTTHGILRLHQYMKKLPMRTLFFSISGKSCPVSRTELLSFQENLQEFQRRSFKLMCLSPDSLEDIRVMSADIMLQLGSPGEQLGFPIISDKSRELSKSIGLLDPTCFDSEGVLVPAQALVVVGANQAVRFSSFLPARCGRSMAETLRIVDSIYLVQDFSLMTPAGWKQGQRVLVGGGLSTDTAKAIYKNLEICAVPSKQQYMRYVDCPVGHEVDSSMRQG